MAKHPRHEFDKTAAIKKIYQKPRSSKDIHQEYMNTAAALGDKHLGMSLAQERVQLFAKETDDILEKLADLKGEYDGALAEEAKLVPPADPPTPTTSPESLPPLPPPTPSPDTESPVPPEAA